MGWFERMEGYASDFADITPSGRRFKERIAQIDNSTGLPLEKLDVVVVHGKNIGECWNPPDIRQQRFYLSPNSRFNVLAAGIMFKLGLTNKILLSTGKTSGKNYPSEAAAMRRQLKRIFPSIPDSAILMEEVSLNTWGNAQEIKKMAEEQNFGKIGVISPGFHIPRVEYLYEKAGLDIVGIASNKVVETRWPDLAQNYRDSELYTREVRREMRALYIQEHAWGRLLDDAVVRVRRNPNYDDTEYPHDLAA